MKIAFAIVVASLGVLVSGCTPLSEDDGGEPPHPRSVPAKSIAAKNPRGNPASAAIARNAQKTKALTFDEYVAQRKSRDAAKTRVAVDPRWEFSPRQALQSLGNVRLFYAVAPWDTGARDTHYVNLKPPRHYGFTVWEVKTKGSQAGLDVACARLVSFGKDTAPAVPPPMWSFKIGQRIDLKYNKILETQVVRICGRDVRLTRYLPLGQCNVPNLEHWNGAFVTGGWAVYLNSAFHRGSDPKAAALDVVRAADLFTDALRTAKTDLDRPEFEAYEFEGILWGNQEATLSFSLESTRGEEICANLWHRVPRKYSETGVKGYGTRIIKVHGDGRIHGDVTASTHGISGEGFQLDWANEFGVGGSIVHRLKPLAALIEELKDERIQVRIEAVFALRRCGAPAVPALISAVKDREGRVRRVAAIALGRIGPAARDAVPALIGALSDADRYVRYPAAVALERIGPAAKQAIPVLKVVRERDPDSKVRRGAAGALKRIGKSTANRE